MSESLNRVGGGGVSSTALSLRSFLAASQSPIDICVIVKFSMIAAVKKCKESGAAGLFLSTIWHLNCANCSDLRHD